MPQLREGRVSHHLPLFLGFLSFFWLSLAALLFPALDMADTWHQSAPTPQSAISVSRRDTWHPNATLLRSATSADSLATSLLAAGLEVPLFLSPCRRSVHSCYPALTCTPFAQGLPRTTEFRETSRFTSVFGSLACFPSSATTA